MLSAMEELDNPYVLTLCMLGNFACFFFFFFFLFSFFFFFFFFFFLTSVDFYFNFIKKNTSFRNTIRVSNSLDPDQSRRFVGPDLGPNGLQSYQQTTNFATSGLRVNAKLNNIS